MPARTASLGSQGEAQAAAHYKAEGYTVLEQNFRTRQGEIDLIVCKGGTLVFAEVKTRTGTVFATPREAVTPHKQRRITAAARAYLANLGTDDMAIRFDVVEVLLLQGEWRVHRLEQAFDAE